MVAHKAANSSLTMWGAQLPQRSLAQQGPSYLRSRAFIMCASKPSCSVVCSIHMQREQRLIAVRTCLTSSRGRWKLRRLPSSSKGRYTLSAGQHRGQGVERGHGQGKDGAHAFDRYVRQVQVAAHAHQQHEQAGRRGRKACRLKAQLRRTYMRGWVGEGDCGRTD